LKLVILTASFHLMTVE